MRLYGKKFLKHAMGRESDARQETRDGVLYDVISGQRLCRVKVQGTNQLITAHYPENWEQNPFWLKPGNTVKIMHTSGNRGRIEVVGHGLVMPTGVSLLPIVGDADVVTARVRLKACETPRMAVLITIGTYRIGGVSYTANPILLGSSSSPYLLEDGGQIDRIAGAVELNAAPSAGYVRYDLISIGTDGIFDYTAGTAVTSDPVIPSPSANHISVGWILVQSGITGIYQKDINAVWYSDIENPGPTPPPPVTEPIGTELSWNILDDFTYMSRGTNRNYYMNNTESNITYIEIMVIAVDPGSKFDCQFTFPDDRTWKQQLVYDMSSNLFQFRSQLFPYPNMPDTYFPEGYYLLYISCLESGTMRIETRRYPF